jgi:predicted alpha/beta superfamily hydrolase
MVEVTGEAADASPPAASAMEATVPRSQVSMLPSSASDREYKVFVGLPLNYTDNSPETYPVVYVVDGSVLFELVTTITRWLALGEEIPEVIVVGIDSGTAWADDFEKWYGLRARELTPTRLAAFPDTGGAGEFLSFLQQDLIPHIDANYQTDPADRTLAGVSLGGLFSLYGLFHAPETFNRFIAVSPSLWWDDRVTFDFEREFATEHADLPVRLFLSVGELEEEPTERYVSNLKEFHEALEDRNYAGLEMEMVVMENETHESGFPDALSKGLRSVFR